MGLFSRKQRKPDVWQLTADTLFALKPWLEPQVKASAVGHSMTLEVPMANSMLSIYCDQPDVAARPMYTVSGVFDGVSDYSSREIGPAGLPPEEVAFCFLAEVGRTLEAYVNNHSKDLANDDSQARRAQRELEAMRRDRLIDRSA